MNKISVAIPTYFSSRFINKTIKSMKDSKLIDEIVVCDDSDSLSEYKNLDRTVRNLLEDTNIKLNISKIKKPWWIQK